MMVGDRIRAARKRAGLTQKELGEQCGIAEPTIRRYELGKLNPKIETLKKIAKPLGVRWYELYEDTDDKISAIKTDIEASSLKQPVQNEFTKAYNDSTLREKAYSEFIQASSPCSGTTEYSYKDGMYLAYLSEIGIAPPDVESLISVGFEPVVAFCIFYLLSASHDEKKEFIEMLQYLKEIDKDAPQNKP